MAARFNPRRFWCCASLGLTWSAICTIVPPASADSWSPRGRTLNSIARASIRHLAETDEDHLTVNDRLGLASQRSEVNLSLVNDPDHPPWEPDLLEISTRAIVMSDVRSQGIVFASQVNGVPQAIDIENMGATSSVNASIELEVTEAFDGVIHLRRNGFANTVGATLWDQSGKEVWSLDALEQNSLVFWNNTRIPGGTPVDVSWHFEPGKYRLTYGHSPQQVVGILGPSSAMLWITPTATSDVIGDFDHDASLTSFDMDLLTRSLQIQKPINANLTLTVEPSFDVNQDKTVDFNDRRFWIESIARTYSGDASLDGQFDSMDLIQVLAAGQYNDSEPGNSGWAEGDWTGDGDFDPSDLIEALQAGGYEQGPRAAVSSVPEPAGLEFCLLGLGYMFCKGWHRKKQL